MQYEVSGNADGNAYEKMGFSIDGKRVRSMAQVALAKTLPARIRYEMEIKDYKPIELATKMRWSLGTYYNRMRSPSDLTIGELEKLSRILRVPLGDLVLGKPS